MKKGKPESKTENRIFSLWETLPNLWGLIKLRLGFGSPSSYNKDVLESVLGGKKASGPELYHPEQPVQPSLPPLPPEQKPVAAPRNDKPVPPPRAEKPLTAKVNEALTQQSDSSKAQPPAGKAPTPPNAGSSKVKDSGRARPGKENKKVASNAKLAKPPNKSLPPDPKPNSGQSTANVNAQVKGLLKHKKIEANPGFSGPPDKPLPPNPTRKS